MSRIQILDFSRYQKQGKMRRKYLKIIAHFWRPSCLIEPVGHVEGSPTIFVCEVWIYTCTDPPLIELLTYVFKKDAFV
jgi:hypothetical protein